MKLIIALIQPTKLEAVKEALSHVEVFRLTVMDVQGFGRQKGYTEVYRGHEFTVNLLRKIELQIAVNEDFVEPTVNAIMEAGRTGPEGRAAVSFLASSSPLLTLRPVPAPAVPTISWTSRLLAICPTESQIVPELGTSSPYFFPSARYDLMLLFSSGIAMLKDDLDSLRQVFGRAVQSSGLMRRASNTLMWSCLEITFSDTISLANALMSPVFWSITQRSSRAGPTAFLAADNSASSTAAARTSRLMPFSRSQNSNAAKKSAFIASSRPTPPRGEQKSRQI